MKCLEFLYAPEKRECASSALEASSVRPSRRPSARVAAQQEPRLGREFLSVTIRPMCSGVCPGVCGARICTLPSSSFSEAARNRNCAPAATWHERLRPACITIWSHEREYQSRSGSAVARVCAEIRKYGWILFREGRTRPVQRRCRRRPRAGYEAVRRSHRSTPKMHFAHPVNAFRIGSLPPVTTAERRSWTLCSTIAETRCARGCVFNRLLRQDTEGPRQ